MKFEFNVEKKHFWMFTTIILLTIAIAGAILVYSYGGSSPEIVGHSAGEIDLSAGVNTDANFNKNVNIGGNSVFTGNVGVGAGSPDLKLTVYGGNLANTQYSTLDLTKFSGHTGNYVQLITRLVRTADGTDWNTAAIQILRRTDITDQAFISLYKNNVGIGISEPSEKLHVLGNAKVEGNLEVTGYMKGAKTGTVLTFNVNDINTECPGNGWTKIASYPIPSEYTGGTDSVVVCYREQYTPSFILKKYQADPDICPTDWSEYYPTSKLQTHSYYNGGAIYQRICYLK